MLDVSRKGLAYDSHATSKNPSISNHSSPSLSDLIMAHVGDLQPVAMNELSGIKELRYYPL